MSDAAPPPVTPVETPAAPVVEATPAAKPEITSMITTEPVKADDKAKPEEKKPDAPPAEFKVSVPKELEQFADKAALEKFTVFAKEKGFTAEQASTMLAFDLERRATEVKSQEDFATQTNATWFEEIKKDKELGGDKLAATQAAVDRFITKYGDAELRKNLVDAGMQNFPPLVRMIVRGAAHLAEDTSGLPGAGGGPSKRESIYDP